MYDAEYNIEVDEISNEIETPAWIIDLEKVHSNFLATVKAAGGIERFMPHVKTHRAPWLIREQVQWGVKWFKAATPQECQMVLENQAEGLLWAYPTLSEAAILRVLNLAKKYQGAQVEILADSLAGFQRLQDLIEKLGTTNVKIRVDLDPGMGRTGIAMGSDALDLCRAVAASGLYAGLHLYDGHIKDTDRARRIERVADVREKLRKLVAALKAEGIVGDAVGGGSYSFDLWGPEDLVRVTPGSWTYSSWEHQQDLGPLGWVVAGYVLSSVVSAHNGTVTLDAGSKAISPDMPMASRFKGVSIEEITGVKEEHSVVVSKLLKPGDRIALIPRHGCTAAYLYDKAYVKGLDGKFSWREQLGVKR